jgi:hypothetical protein
LIGVRRYGRLCRSSREVQTGKHVHRRLEETFYMLDGEFEFEVGSETFRGRSGAYAELRERYDTEQISTLTA